MSEGCTCQRCQQRYRVDILVPDELWARISLGSNLLCPRCIGEKLESLNVFAAFRLEPVP